MPIKDPIERALAFFAQDYSCSQSLLLAFASQVGIEPDMAARIAAPFAGGMGRLGYTCGAVSGAIMIIGLRYGHQIPDDEERKERLYQKARDFIASFKEKHGSILCRDLTGHDISTSEGLEKARAEGVFDDRCPNFVRDAAIIVRELLNQY